MGTTAVPTLSHTQRKNMQTPEEAMHVAVGIGTIILITTGIILSILSRWGK